MAFTGPLEDRIAIRELMNTHAHGVMTRDAKLWGSIWAEDAYWALPEYPDLGGFDGKDAIVAAWVESMNHYGLDDMARPMVYFMEPGSIEVTGDRATAVAYTHEVYQDPQSRKLVRGYAATTTNWKSAGGSGCSPGASTGSCTRSRAKAPT